MARIRSLTAGNPRQLAMAATPKPARKVRLLHSISSTGALGLVVASRFAVLPRLPRRHHLEVLLEGDRSRGDIGIESLGGGGQRDA